ncbi:MAG: OmpA family protein [Pseudomonadota bacterium]
MSFKGIKDSLPWLVPSVVIAAVGTGYLKTVNDAPTVVAPASQAGQATASEAQIERLQAALDAVLLANAKEEVVARQATSADALVELPQPAPRAEPEVAVVEPVATPPAPEPVDDRVAALTTPHAAAKLFTSGQAAAEDAARCMEDLRNLTAQAVVYFPSGGVTADAGGVEQGRLIGLVAQSCDGVRIKVEGHSDASGDPAANLRLSEQRAQQVITRIAASGIDTSMFFAEGAGDRRPSGIVGPQSRAYYDRRVEFSVVEENATRVAARAPGAVKPWANATCVTALERAASGTSLFYAPRSVSLPSQDLDTALELASLATECPHARLRVVGHYSGDIQAREDTRTGLLRAKALMAMLVGRGIPSEQIIIAAHSRPLDESGLPGSRVNFDVILEEE